MRGEEANGGEGGETPFSEGLQSDAHSEVAIDGAAFLRVQQLSRMMGISENSIRSQMRMGLFPVPHRAIGRLIVVKRDDYQRWYESPPPPTLARGPRQAKPPRGVSAAVCAPAPTAGRERKRRAFEPETLANEKARQMQEVRETLRREGLLP